jgi:hypothetical protein
MTGISFPSNSPSLYNGHSVKGLKQIQLPPSSPISDEMKSALGIGNPEFEKMLRISKDPSAIDPAESAKNRATPIHTIIRQNGKIIAAIGKDEQSRISNAFAARVNWSKIDKQAAGMSREQYTNLLATELAKVAGKTAVVEQFPSGRTAPTRGDLQDGRLGSW